MKYLKFIFFLFAINNLNAQIDTTDWYPLHIGDKWEYWSPGFDYYQYEVLGDTLMPNGKTYFKLDLNVRNLQRIENNRYVMVYNPAEKDSEYVRYDLNAGKGDIFYPPKGHSYGYGCFETGEDIDNVLLKKLEWKEYREVYFDSTVTPPDTIWENVVDGYWPRITKGLGVTSYAYGLETLVGAVINGVEIGTLVSVEEKPEIVNKFKLHQNYPNPFNPNTTISYSLPAKGEVILKIYNSLGQEVKTLVNEFKEEGIHKVNFDTSNLPSGVYIYSIQANDFYQSKKMILLK